MNLRLFGYVAKALFSGKTPSGNAFRVQHTAKAGLKQRIFNDNGVKTVAVEQNPAKASVWGDLARKGHKVVQFRQDGKYVAVAVDGSARPYTGKKRA